ncbi:GDSL-type esterase/lipase family protein [Calothrix rhizosoleniae]|uniref:GDSL-type esterase/lipase family protein n=1 Tax=Calothrix rhizosoleniae TaxID=888997 RepID=UPI000B49CB18|nr:GDSL-type esterase/lipase family protein [Calothrix rhizosoleniae]
MRDIYLVAASLLTGLTVPTSALPQSLLMKVSNHPSESGVKNNSPIITNGKIEAVAEISPPEFSQPRLSNSANSSPSSKVVISRKVSSGPQMYYQRLSALRAGRIYTRLSANTWYPSSVSSKRFRKLTYTDWKTLLAMEARAMADGQGNNHLSILLGDSLSMWFPKEKLPDGQLWLNQGISGDTSTGILKRLSVFSATRPRTIYIMAGINDLRRGTKAKTIINNHRLMIRRLRRIHPKTEIIIQSILPTSRPNLPNHYIRYINKQLAMVAKQEGAKFINIHHWFIDFQGNLRPELTTDGLHLSQQGYEVWRSALQQPEYRLTGLEMLNVSLINFWEQSKLEKIK